MEIKAPEKLVEQDLYCLIFEIFMGFAGGINYNAVEEEDENDLNEIVRRLTKLTEIYANSIKKAILETNKESLKDFEEFTETCIF